MARLGLIGWVRSSTSMIVRGASAVLSSLLSFTGLMGPLRLDQQIMMQRSGLTPTDVMNAMNLADTGEMWQLVDIFNKFRQQVGHLQSVVYTRETAVAGLKWRVTPGNKSRKAAKVARFVEYFLRSFGNQIADQKGEDDLRDLHTLIAHIMGSVIHGTTVAEIVWQKKQVKIQSEKARSRELERRARGGRGRKAIPTKSKARVVPVGCIPVHPRRIAFDREEGRPHIYDATGGPCSAYPGIDILREYPAGKYIVAQNRLNGDADVREGLIRLLTWLGLFYNVEFGDWLKLIELAAKPWRIGYYTKGASKEDRMVLVEALRQLSSNGVAVLPDTTELKVEWPQGGSGSSSKNGGMHDAILRHIEKQMSKAVLGQTMTADDGSSKSQAEVHNEVRRDIRDGDARFVAAVILRQLIVPAVQYNFGTDAPMPGFEFILEEADDLVKVAEAAERFAKANLPVPYVEILGRAGLSEPKPGDIVLTGLGLRTYAPPELTTNQQAISGEDGKPAPQGGNEDDPKLPSGTPANEIDPDDEIEIYEDVDEAA